MWFGISYLYIFIYVSQSQNHIFVIANYGFLILRTAHRDELRGQVGGAFERTGHGGPDDIQIEQILRKNGVKVKTWKNTEKTRVKHDVGATLQG